MDTDTQNHGLDTMRAAGGGGGAGQEASISRRCHTSSTHTAAIMKATAQTSKPHHKTKKSIHKT